MKLTQFLTDYPTIIKNNPVIILSTPPEQPILFFSLFLDRIKRENACALETLDCGDVEFAVLLAKLQTSFLGMRALYWLKNVQALDEKKKEQLMRMLSAYAGPHTVIAQIPAGNLKQQAVEIPEQLGNREFGVLVQWLHGPGGVQRVAPFIARLFESCDGLPLDQACLMAAYARLLGNSYQQFLSSWLTALIVPEKSLFTLSQHFFAKSPKKFFTHWAEIGSEYPEQFWITFWSEQVWRGYHYCALMQQNKYADAKAIAFRLPFSLINGDWKKLKLAELKHAHDFLYSCDSTLKNGGGSLGLDLFYAHFFAGS